MKKLFVLAIALILTFSINAQKVGLKAGYGMSGYVLNFDKPDASKMATGYNFGIVGEMELGEIAGRLDIGYIQLGSDFFNEGELGGFSFKSDLKTNVNYFQIGVAAKKSFGPAYTFGGPYLGYALKNVTNGEITFNDTTALVEDLDNFKNFDGSDNDFYNKIDYGVYGGAGLNIKDVFIEVNVGYGLMNFMNKESDTYQANTDRAIQINDDGLDAQDENFRYSDGSAAVEEPTQFNLFFGISAGYLFGF